MAIANIKDFLAKSKDTPLTLNAKIKEFEAGTTVALVNVINVQGKDMAMVAVPGGRPFAAPPENLDVVGGAAAAPAEDENEPSIEGPVLDLFSTHANLDNQLGLNFVTSYITVFGTEDVSFISNLVEGAGLPIGQPWTAEQTADLALQFYDAFGLEADPLAVSTLEEAKAAALKAPAETPAATTKAPRGKGATKATATAPAANKVDKDGWDATHVGALRIMGALAPFYADSPDSFNDELALAVKMLSGTDKVK